MNPEIKTKWVAALRSGEFKQGKGTLRRSTTDQYCCLGVLCELYRRETGRGEWTTSPHVSKMRFLDNESILPDEVRHWAGLSYNNPIDLVAKNDAEISIIFSEIADIIDAKL